MPVLYSGTDRYGNAITFTFHILHLAPLWSLDRPHGRPEDDLWQIAGSHHLIFVYKLSIILKAISLHLKSLNMDNNNISRTSLEKDTKDHLDTFNEKEQGDDVDRHLQVQLPESLQGLSAEEIAKIDKEATRKLDILLMPILVILYILYVRSLTHLASADDISNYLDRQNIASAKIAGIDKDLGLTATQYSTAVAVLFAGYVALQIPSNMVASKISVPGICKCP